MRFAGITALCTAIGLTGIYFLNIHRKKLRLFRCLADFFGEFSVMTSLSSSDALTYIERLGKMKRFSELTFPSELIKDAEDGCNLRDIWCNAFLKSRESMLLDERSRELILSFSDAFGKYTAAEFSEKCSEYAHRFNDIYTEEKKASENKRSLMAGAGILTAAAVFIILV